MLLGGTRFEENMVGCLVRDVVKPSYEFQLKLFNVFKRPGTPGAKWGNAYICIFKVRANNKSSVHTD